MTKKALITGGAHPMGIGFSAAKSLVRDGFEVVVTGISEEEIALTPRQDGVKTAVVDVQDEGAIAGLIEKFDALDALVNCAGIGSIDEFDPKHFAKTINVNLTGTMRMCVAAQPLLEKSTGAIVNIASMHSTFGNPIAPGYSASKGGVVQLTKSFAAAWGKNGIRVNAIAPGYIKTNMARPLWENAEFAERIISRTPMGRWGEPGECGDVIAFLCSSQARFVSGAVIPVDGGYLVDG